MRLSTVRPILAAAAVTRSVNCVWALSAPAGEPYQMVMPMVMLLKQRTALPLFWPLQAIRK